MTSCLLLEEAEEEEEEEEEDEEDEEDEDEEEEDETDRTSSSSESSSESAGGAFVLRLRLLPAGGMASSCSIASGVFALFFGDLPGVFDFLLGGC